MRSRSALPLTRRRSRQSPHPIAGNGTGFPSCKRPVHGVPAAGDEPPPSGIVTCQVYVLADSLGRSSAGPDDLPKEEIAAEAGSVSPGVADTTAWPSSVRA
jgi:hypothetical protein